MKRKIEPVELDSVEPLEKDPTVVGHRERALDIEKYVDAEEAMQFLGIKSKTTFCKLKSEGKVKSYAFSRKLIRYKLSELDALLRKHRAS